MNRPVDPKQPPLLYVNEEMLAPAPKIEFAPAPSPYDEPNWELECLSFSKALVLLKSGAAMTRSGWNRGGQYVRVQRPDAHSKMQVPYLYLRNAQGELVPWVPSQGDLFARDWQVWMP